MCQRAKISIPLIIIRLLIIILYPTLSHSYHCIRCDREECKSDAFLRAVKCNRTDIVGCATLKQEDGSLKRMCIRPEEAKYCKSKPKSCSFCNSSYLCNIEGMQGLICFSCNGDRETCSPKTNPFNLELEKCRATDRCFSSVYKEGEEGIEHIYRGCMKMNVAGTVKEKFCDNAFKKGGSCRICHKHLCNSVEAGFTGGDTFETKPRQQNMASSHGTSILLSLYIACITVHCYDYEINSRLLF